MGECVIRHIIAILFGYFGKNIHRENCTFKWLAIVAKDYSVKNSESLKVFEHALEVLVCYKVDCYSKNISV